jgi:hypothetical protein
MFKTRRRTAIGITALATVVSTIALAVPAQAVTIPLWPTAGRVPTGCDASVGFLFIDSTHWQYTYTDASFPTTTSAVFGNNATNTTVLPVAGTNVTATVKRTEPCGGGAAGDEFVLADKAGTVVIDTNVTQSTADAFAQTLTYTQLMKPDQAGIYRFATMRNTRRYDTVVLDQDFKLVSTTAGTGAVLSAGAWSLTPSYLLRATTLTNALSATRLAKGKTVKATAQLKYATNAGFANDAGSKVAVQTKVGTGKWVTNATLTTNASGVVTYSFVLSATTSVRFVHAKLLSGKFTNAVISPIKVVTKI